MSELPPEGYPEGSRRVWGLTIITIIDVFNKEKEKISFKL